MDASGALDAVRNCVSALEGRLTLVFIVAVLCGKECLWFNWL